MTTILTNGTNNPIKFTFNFSRRGAENAENKLNSVRLEYFQEIFRDNIQNEEYENWKKRLLC